MNIPFPCIIYIDGRIKTISPDQVDGALEALMTSENIECVLDEWGDLNKK